MRVSELCRKQGFWEARYYRWKSKYGGMEASDLKRVKGLEAENVQLKRMYADLALENSAMNDLIEKTVRPAVKRDAARYLIEEHALPVARSCRCGKLSPSAFYPVPEDCTVRDAQLISALAALVDGRSSLGLWKCRKLLGREGRPWNHKRIYRVYKRMNLHLRRPAKKRLPKRLRVPLYVPRLPDTVWSADFMSDTLLCGRRFRTFNLVDDFNGEAMHIEVDTSITSKRLIRNFERLQSERCLPQVLRTDNGPEFLGEPFTSWAKHNGMAIQYIQPGKASQNAYIERFNRTFRDELLDQDLFATFDNVRGATYWWMIEYNEERPHDALDELTPMEARLQSAGNSTTNCRIDG